MTVGPIRKEKEVEQDWRLTTEDRTAQIMTTKDRVAQINWLRELAGNIAANLGEGTAEELVQHALCREGRESWGITIPEWYTLRDQELLIEWVAESL